jgi:hypothetical protein
MNEFYLTIFLLLGVSLTSYFWMSSLDHRIKRLERREREEK